MKPSWISTKKTIQQTWMNVYIASSSFPEFTSTTWHTHTHTHTQCRQEWQPRRRHRLQTTRQPTGKEVTTSVCTTKRRKHMSYKKAPSNPISKMSQEDALSTVIPFLYTQTFPQELTFLHLNRRCPRRAYRPPVRGKEETAANITMANSSNAWGGVESQDSTHIRRSVEELPHGYLS